MFVIYSLNGTISEQLELDKMGKLKKTSFRIDEELLKSAKKYADLNHTTVSQLLRDYFVSIHRKLKRLERSE